MSLNEARNDDDSRDARMFKKRNFPEEKRIEDVVKKEALAHCRTEVGDFIACEKVHGLMVIFNCRAVNKIMNDCMNSKMTTEHIGEVRLRRVLEKEAREAAAAKAIELAEVAARTPVKKGWW
mmetsp:Transcript_42455/g.100976  ORF Transcript_42455/g.100976 Transcript_42455/m.100976 type:complete len:122 (+) Transcript_42455:43-408(+)